MPSDDNPMPGAVDASLSGGAVAGGQGGAATGAGGTVASNDNTTTGAGGMTVGTGGATTGAGGAMPSAGGVVPTANDNSGMANGADGHAANNNDPAVIASQATQAAMAGGAMPASEQMPTNQPASLMGADSEVLTEVVRRIGEAHNVLVALSGNPSVDEMAAAIGLSIYLDKLGKRATAIYSGATPNALEFLKPEATFETTADVLQDFVIALNKDKADHLRYKLDGDYVKIYITPYKSKVSQEDLEYSYDDYNVDLVLALDVANGVDLDAALREHGRIMHDSVIINITTGNPGKLGEIEWSDKSASSVSEMIARLLYRMNVNGEAKLEKEEATAFLTGIVAATDRFSNARTTPETMRVASRLMESGANQQLVSKNITSDVENEMFNVVSEKKTNNSTEGTEGVGSDDGRAAETGDAKAPEDPTKLDISHKNELEQSEANTGSESGAVAGTANGAKAEAVKSPEAGAGVAEKAEVKTESSEEVATRAETTEEAKTNTQPSEKVESKQENEKIESPDKKADDNAALMTDLKAAEANLAAATAEVVSDNGQSAVKIEENNPSLPPVVDTAVTGASGTTMSAQSPVANTNPAGLGASQVSSGSESSQGSSIKSEGIGPSGMISAPDVTGMGAASAASGMISEPGLSEMGTGSTASGTIPESGSSGTSDSDSFMKETPEKVIQPSSDVMGTSLPPVAEENKYGEMLEKALEGLDKPGSESIVSSSGSTSDGANGASPSSGGDGLNTPASASMGNGTNGASIGSAMMGNLATMNTPTVAANPEINGVPEINYVPTSADAILPPPPAPPISADMTMPGEVTGGTPAVQPIQPAVPVEEPAPTSLGRQPAMQDQVYHPQAADPGAFKIPGM